MDVKVSIHGLVALNRSLRQIDTEAPKGLRIALNSAADLLISRTRPLIPKLTGAAANSLKARSTRTTARVGVGGRKAPYYPWLDFGGAGKKPGRPAHRPFFKEGRYLYPTLRKIRPEIEQQLHEALTAVVRNVGLEQD